MLNTFVDGWYTWLGTALAGVAVLGVALGLPATAPPSTAEITTAVDATATSEYDVATSVALDADAVRVTPRGVSLRGSAGVARGAFRYGPVTPVDDGPLAAVLDGAAPDSQFETPAAMTAAARSARGDAPRWRTAPRRLRVRHVTWGGIDVTLVG